MSPGQIALFVVVSILVIAAAYYATYFLATRAGQGGVYGARQRTIRVRDRFSLTKDKSVCLIEVKDKIYLVALTSQGATLLDTYYLEEFADSKAADEAGQTARATGSTESKAEKPERKPQTGSGFAYQPQGIIEKGLFNGINAIKNSIAQSKRGKQQQSKNTTSAGQAEDKIRDKPEQRPVGEDDLDLVYRRLQNRRNASVRDGEKSE